MVCLAILPTEVIVEVFKWLDLLTVEATSRTCRALNEIMFSMV